MAMREMAIEKTFRQVNTYKINLYITNYFIRRNELKLQFTCLNFIFRYRYQRKSKQKISDRSSAGNFSREKALQKIFGSIPGNKIKLAAKVGRSYFRKKIIITNDIYNFYGK